MLSVFINLFHLCLVLFTIVAPFTDRPGILILHISYTISLLSHWYLNDNSCCLTLFESTLTGSDSKDTFMHKLISPMYNISETKLSKLVWLSTILLLLVSSYKYYIYLKTLKIVTVQALFDTNPIKIEK